MMKYEDPKLNIQEFDKSNIVTMSANAHELVNGLENGNYNSIVQVSYNDIIAFQ